MKTEIHIITVELKWTFIDGGQTVRSNVVGGLQAEVDSHSVRIYERGGQCVVNVPRGGGRKRGMELAANKIGRLIQGDR